MNRNSGKKNNFLLWIISILLIISLIIIGFSVYIQQTPDKATKYLLNKITGKNIELQPSVNSLISKLEIKNNLIDSLSFELKKYNKVIIHKKALVNVEEGTLNMRDKPQLASNIIVRIPDSSFVDVLYFDTEIYYLGGKRGRWCKVKYSDKEGWVWDGFIKIEE